MKDEGPLTVVSWWIDLIIIAVPHFYMFYKMEGQNPLFTVNFQSWLNREI
jgi:hypothetical protein